MGLRGGLPPPIADATERRQLRSGNTTDYRRSGWRERRQRDADARIVRCLDFERALSTLPMVEQAALIATYRDGLRHHATACAIGCSERKLAYVLPLARLHLAETLDRLDLL